MKVILLRDVARLGKKSEVKDVPDGHAINFLIPRKLAITASKENIERLKDVAGKRASSAQETLESFKTALATHAHTPIVCTVDANEQGHLFKGIRAEDVVSLLNTQGFSITKQNITLKAPLKSVGVHIIPLTHAGVEGTLQLEVVKK